MLSHADTIIGSRFHPPQSGNLDGQLTMKTGMSWSNVASFASPTGYTYLGSSKNHHIFMVRCSLPQAASLEPRATLQLRHAPGKER